MREAQAPSCAAISGREVMLKEWHPTTPMWLPFPISPQRAPVIPQAVSAALWDQRSALYLV